MPFLTRCPYCKKRVQAPDRALGASAKCPGCGAWYTVAPDDTPDEPDPSPNAPPATAQPVARAEPTAPAPTTPVPALAPTAAAPVLATESPSESGTGGAGALVLGALVCVAALAVIVLANVEPATGLVRLLAAGVMVFGLAVAGTTASTAGARPAAVALGGAGLSGLTLALALFAPGALGPTYERSRQKIDPNAEALRAIPLQFGPDASALPDSASYVDSSRFALQQSYARVQIADARVGPVQVIDSKRRFTKEHYLALSVRVQHLGHGAPFRFAHWGSRTASDVPAAVVTVNGRRLAPAHLGRDVALGVTPAAEVPSQSAADLLLFEVPEPNRPVRVELPAEAWGGTGAFKFEVPAGMIVRAPQPKPN